MTTGGQSNTINTDAPASPAIATADVPQAEAVAHPIPHDIMERAAALRSSVLWESNAAIELIAEQLMAERRGATLAERERCAQLAERDTDWVAFGKTEIWQPWENGPDDVRDYRLGIVTGRAIAAAIRNGDR